MKTDVIIPVRNELDTITGVVQAFWRHPKIRDVHVVINGEPHENLLDYQAKIAGFDNAYAFWYNGEGKGQAVKYGLGMVDSPRVCFCDGDLRGLTWRHVDILMRPYAGMVVGYPERPKRMPVPWPVSDDTWQMVSGQRCLPTEFARRINLHGYAMESQTNMLAAKEGMPVRFFKLNGVIGKVRQNDKRMAELRRDREWLQSHGSFESWTTTGNE